MIGANEAAEALVQMGNLNIKPPQTAYSVWQEAKDAFQGEYDPRKEQEFWDAQDAHAAEAVAAWAWAWDQAISHARKAARRVWPHCTTPASVIRRAGRDTRSRRVSKWQSAP